MTKPNTIARSTLRSSLCGPTRNVYSLALGVVFSLSLITLFVGRLLQMRFAVVASIADACVSFVGAIYYAWNRVGWIELDVASSRIVFHTDDLDHEISLKKGFEWIEGRNGEFQSVSLRQSCRFVFRYRNESDEDVERWKTLPHVSDRIVPSLLVSTEVGRVLHLLVREHAQYRPISYVEAAFALSMAFSAEREEGRAELAN